MKTERKMLWQCDNGTYDIIDGVDDETGEDCITHMNVPLSVLVAAPDLLAIVQRLANPDDGELLTLADYRQIARNAIAKANGA